VKKELNAETSILSITHTLQTLCSIVTNTSFYTNSIGEDDTPSP